MIKKEEKDKDKKKDSKKDKKKGQEEGFHGRRTTKLISRKERLQEG
jgi:hypothetical protein